MNDAPSATAGRIRSLLAFLLPLPILPAVSLYLIYRPHGAANKILIAPGMVAFPCVFGRMVHPTAFFFVAAAFWYIAAAALLHAMLAPRRARRPVIFWIFIVFAAAVAFTAWQLSGWNPD